MEEVGFGQVGRIIPEWVDCIAVDPDGSMWGFEEHPFFDGQHWIPIDDFDGLQYVQLAPPQTFSYEGEACVYCR